MSSNHEEPSHPAGPVLYLEESELKASETFCTDVFDNAHGDYRVVQLTSSRTFESLRDSLDVHLEHIDDPSEAAVIITTPTAEEDTAIDEVGDDTPLYGFRVNPQDLTGISVAFSRLLEKWEDNTGTTRICLRDIESLLPYHDTELIYRFLNTILATLQGAGAEVHAHLRPSAMDDSALSLVKSLFSDVVAPDDQKLKHISEAASTERSEEAPNAKSSESFEAAGETVTTATMSDEQIDDFLESEGLGTLSFGGDPPYSIPMSYGYDAEKRVVYLHMSAYDDSEKQARLENSDSVSLVVSRYDRPDKWRSVIVDGTLTRLTDEETQDRDVITAYADSKLASVDVFEHDLSDISFHWYALTPTDISGRRSVREM
jgi:nitroimidazol reductase NimA-like FMN-containing flavoprotein (pyridoxamine 5'-phosphate oxidase superfamily)